MTTDERLCMSVPVWLNYFVCFWVGMPLAFLIIPCAFAIWRRFVQSACPGDGRVGRPLAFLMLLCSLPPTRVPWLLMLGPGRLLNNLRACVVDPTWWSEVAGECVGLFIVVAFIMPGRAGQKPRKERLISWPIVYSSAVCYFLAAEIAVAVLLLCGIGFDCFDGLTVIGGTILLRLVLTVGHRPRQKVS